MDTTSVHSSVGPSRASSDRLLVLEVSTNNDSKILRTVSPSCGDQVLIALCHEWIETAVETGHIVRIVLTASDGTYQAWESAYTSNGHPIVVTRDCNLLIHHPDTLIPSTAVADSFMCLRRSVLNYRSPTGKLSDTTAGSEAALFGHLIHDMFQIMLARDTNARSSAETDVIDWGSQGLDTESFFEAAEEALYRHYEDLFAAGVSDRDARLVLHRIATDIMSWYQGFMRRGNHRSANGVPVVDGKFTRNIVVTEVHDIEELIWSPVFGLKGKVDATIHIRVDGADIGIGILELKTGKGTGYSGLYHSAQVTLYNMLMSDRKDRMVNHALLTYIPYQGALRAVKAERCQSSFARDRIALLQTQSNGDNNNKHRYIVSSRGEVVGLVMQRNRLASYLRLEAPIEELPPFLSGKEEVCAKCFSNESCLVQHKLLENGTLESVSDGAGASLFENKTSHLKPEYESYYRFWKLVLACEQEHAGHDVKEIWTLSGEKREGKGACLSRLKLDVSMRLGCKNPVGLLSPSQTVKARFIRHPRVASTQPGMNHSLSTTGISEGDYVVVSAERNLSADKICSPKWEATATWQCALTNGFVQGISQKSVTVAVDRNLEAWLSHQGLESDDVYWRIDCQEVYSSYNIAKKTLESLFGTNEAFGIAKLRELVVELRPPESRNDFEERSYEYIAQSFQPLAGMNLNVDQEVAVRMSLKAKDYVLILGMPGTGKTTTLAAIILATALQGQSVLVCSHTNSAVDNLLGKLLDLGFDDFIRLGRNLEVVDARVHRYHFSRRFTAGRPVCDLERELQKPRVVATTCLGICHPLLVRRSKFDLVVVDEASQILQPICLGPLQFAGGPFILVGDHYQLPPLQRTSTESETWISDRNTYMSAADSRTRHFKILASGRERSQTESLFRRLCVAHPSAMVALTKQYRMAEEIMNLSNELVYSGSLKCGSAEVSNQALRVSMIRAGRRLSPWMMAVLNPSERILFLDVEQGDARSRSSQAEEKRRNRRKRSGHEDSWDRENGSEANVVIAILRSLVEEGVHTNEITVLSPFRAQVHLIKKKAECSVISTGMDLSGVEVSTIDQYQGKENSCVVVSFVRGGRRSIGPLLNDWRRVNVALTRAKKKMILVGSSATLSVGGKLLETMMTYLTAKRRVYQVGTLT